MYDLEETRIIAAIKEQHATKVLLQLPEGLKKEATRLSNLIQEQTQATVYVSGEPSWGACDLPLDAAKQLHVDFIVHFGHAPFHKPDFPILYVETHFKKDLNPLLTQHIQELKQHKTLGLVASVQHVHQLQPVKALLEQQGFTVLVHEPKGRAYHQGQILGCEYTGPKRLEKEVDAFLSLSNQFHSLGLAMSTDKPVYLFDPANETFQNLTELKDREIRKRYALIEKAKEAQTFGIIVSRKSGQANTAVAEHLKKKIEQHGKEAVILSMQEIMPDELINFSSVDAFVVTACPRVAIEDVTRYHKPLLTMKELLVVLGELSWEDSLQQGLIIAPYGAK